MQLNLVAHFEKTGIGKMYFCKEQKKSAAFATDLLAGAEGLFLLARRSSVRTALPCQRARYSLPSYSRPSARSKEKNRLLSQPTFLAGAEGLEPSTKVLETHVLPLHHTPKHLFSIT